MDIPTKQFLFRMYGNMCKSRQTNDKNHETSNFKYSIIIPTYNSKHTIVKLLDSIFATKGHEHFEIIVVDDASTDQTYKVVKTYPVRIIVSSKNMGSAHARNTGAFAAQSPYLIFFDADVVIKPDTLERLTKRIEEKNENYVFMGIYDENPVKINFISQYKALLDSYHWRNIKTKAVTSFEPRCAIMKKSLFEKSGGFDDTIVGADVEDYELGYRLLDINAKLIVDPEIKVYHHFPMSVKHLISTLFNRTKSWIQLFSSRKKFDNVGSTIESALACGISGLSSFLLPAIGFETSATLAFLLMFSLFWVIFSDFFLHAFYEKGICFGVKVIFFHYFICIVIFWGAVKGISRRLCQCMINMWQPIRQF